MFREIFFYHFILSGVGVGAVAAKIENPGAGAAKNERLRNTGFWSFSYAFPTETIQNIQKRCCTFVLNFSWHKSQLREFAYPKSGPGSA